MKYPLILTDQFSQRQECATRFKKQTQRIFDFLKSRLPNGTGVDIGLGDIFNNPSDGSEEYRHIAIFDTVQGSCTLLRIMNWGEMKVFRYGIDKNEYSVKTAIGLLRSRFFDNTSPKSDRRVTIKMMKKNPNVVFCFKKSTSRRKKK